MRSWQIRNILTTIALAVCCGVATAGPESASSEPPSASSEVKSETKQSTTGAASETKSRTAATKKSPPAAETKKSTAARAGKGGTKATARAKTKAAAPAKSKTTAQAKTEKAAGPAPGTVAPAKTAKISGPGKAAKVPHRVTGGGVGVLPSVPARESTTPDIGIHGIKERARWAPPELCSETDKKVQGTVRAIDKEASKSGDRLVMARIAAEFRTPAETILAERTRLSAPWGELVVAHTLLASVPGVTVDQLFDMRSEGLGWGQVAHGLGLSQKEVASAVQAEGRVVRGKSKPDGSPARIATVEPRAVVDETAHVGSPTPEVGVVNVGTSAPEPVQK
jgi:hypothetical protein